MNKKVLSSNQFISESRERTKNLWRNNLILLVSLLILIFVAPLLDQFSELVTRSSLILVVLSGIFAAEYQKRIFNLLLSLGLLVLLSTAFTLFFPQDKTIPILTFLLMTLSLVLSTIALIAHISKANTVKKSTVLCAINSYLLLGLTASILFIIVDLVEPESFLNLDSGFSGLSAYIYFGFVTLSTLGYGDITPSAPLARSLSVFVAVSGQLYLVIVMALIIGKFLKSEK